MLHPVAFIMFVSACLVFAGRFMVPGHALSLAGTYEAFAHIWVGFAIAVSIFRWEKEGKIVLVLLVALTVLETVMFLCRP